MCDVIRHACFAAVCTNIEAWEIVLWLPVFSELPRAEPPVMWYIITAHAGMHTCMYARDFVQLLGLTQTQEPIYAAGSEHTVASLDPSKLCCI